MAGYNDTRRMIVKTLMGRPTGTEIQPEDHQAFALQITDYVRSVELLAGNATPIGFAEADTVPVRPNNGQALYLSQVNRGETVTFNNFIDQDGNAITVVSNENTVTLVNLLWNTLYWTKQETRISLEKSVHGDDIVDGAVTTPKIADGAVTNTKLSAEVQAILNDVANKQNITDASLATIAKTIVGAINEVYKGGLKDASIATSKIEDGAITEDKLASQSVTNAKIANASVSEEKITDNSVSTEKLKDGAITEPKLDTDLVNVITSAVQPAELASAIAAALTSYVAKSDIVDTTGSATDKVISQQGVTEAINGVTNKVTELESKTEDILGIRTIELGESSQIDTDIFIPYDGKNGDILMVKVSNVVNTPQIWVSSTLEHTVPSEYYINGERYTEDSTFNITLNGD